MIFLYKLWLSVFLHTKPIIKMTTKEKTYRHSSCKQFILMALMAILTLASCTVDYYDPNYMQQMAREAFPVKDIDPNQMWKTTSVITVTVTTEKAERVYIYQGNPYSTSDNAYLLAVKDVQAGTSDICFDAPTALQTLFVARRNAEGMSEAVAAEIKDGGVEVDFTNGTRKAQRRNLPRRAAAYDASWVVEVKADDMAYFPATEPANAIPYTGGWSTDANQVEPVTIELEVPEDFNLTEHGDFFIADAHGTVHLPRFTQGFQPGQAPYAICVPGKWLWPVEFSTVTLATTSLHRGHRMPHRTYSGTTLLHWST